MRRPNLDSTDTIFALATGSLPSAIAVEKLAGQKAQQIAEKIFRRKDGAPHKRNGVSLGTLYDLDNNKIDQALLLSFVSPHSFTGEDTIEFHCHGSLAIIAKLEDVLVQLGARPAEKGEFSYRALLNGKLLPNEIESLGDLFLAEQAADLEAIYGRKDDSLVLEVGRIRDVCIQLQALFESSVDFPEEQTGVTNEAAHCLDRAIHGCSSIIQRYSAFSWGSTVPRIVIAGSPNVGKSSLFNALLCRYRSLVHERPGTTRDVVEEDIEISGRRWKLVDTAGLHEANDGVEQEGIRLGEKYLSGSVFWLLVVDGTKGTTQADVALLEKFGQKPHLLVWNKCDLSDWTPPVESEGTENFLAVSAVAGTHLAELSIMLGDLLKEYQPRHEGPLPMATQRVRLEGALEDFLWLKRNLGVEPPEILAERNRILIGKLSGVTGEIQVEDVLDRIFREFCIGK
ncbi:MAG: tRNA uridine-5-carboxymethylaminomethyl(34) synthesis GTPase MnmE [Deltaproteobacteria bacterium]|nr:tRNA uridine-5-carboxymethylaminomethyl(34) synthesis GTPase MnmE [Deltaproteobacteria bacterium]